MGYRTVVMLNNDTAHHWQHDPQLGALIAMSSLSYSHGKNNLAQMRAGGVDYGRVVQCVHADEQTLAVLDAYQGFQVLAGKSWRRDQHQVNMPLMLLLEAADALGYRLVEKNAP